MSIAAQYKMLTEEQKQTDVSLEFILDNNGVKDAYWALRCWNYDDYCLLLADIAESTLSIFEKKYSEDKRPREVILAIRLYKSGKIKKEDLKRAADAAADAADAAYTQWKKNEEMMREFIKNN